jgi:LysM repeat protein
MKKSSILVLFLFLFFSLAFAQQKKYVSYTVKQGETIKQIAKDLDISTRDLLRLNPDVSRKPRPNTVIIIPNKNYGKEEVKTTIKIETTYEVKPKETLFGISRMFGITVDELKLANGGLNEGLKIGMRLVIPERTITQPKDSVNYVLHTVIKDDTSYNLSKRYNVSQESLLRLNPGLSEGLKLGMLLKIKPKEQSIVEEAEKGVFKEALNFDKKIEIALMLPYQLNKLNDSIVIETLGRNRATTLSIATDFHLGASLAIDSLRAKGLSVNVRYFDTQNSNYKLQSIVRQNDFSNTDVIIGPLFFDKAHWLSKNSSTMVVAPIFSKKQESLSNSKNLIKSIPDAVSYEKKLVDYLETNYKGENVVVINDEKAENQSKLWRVVNKMKSFDSIQNISVIKSKDGFIANEIFEEKLDSMAPNWVVILTNDNVTTSAAVNNLKGFAERIDIDLFALKKGENFDKIDNNFLGKLNFIFPTTEFIDLDQPHVKNFYSAFESKNYALPSKYAIRGFDITYDILVRIATNRTLVKGLKGGESSRVASIFNYEKKPFGNLGNSGLILIHYKPDLTFEILK